MRDACTQVQPQLTRTTTLDPMTQSYARTDYAESLEQAMNEQISIEYNISYLYHSMHNFFARDTIGLPGFARYFDDASTGTRPLKAACLALLPCFGSEAVLSHVMLYVMLSETLPAEERLHSQKLMYLQNVRGGRVKLLSISTPESEVLYLSTCCC